MGCRIGKPCLDALASTTNIPLDRFSEATLWDLEITPNSKTGLDERACAQLVRERGGYKRNYPFSCPYYLLLHSSDHSLMVVDLKLPQGNSSAYKSKREAHTPCIPTNNALGDKGVFWTLSARHNPETMKAFRWNDYLDLAPRAYLLRVIEWKAKSTTRKGGVTTRFVCLNNEKFAEGTVTLQATKDKKAQAKKGKDNAAAVTSVKGFSWAIATGLGVLAFLG